MIKKENPEQIIFDKIYKTSKGLGYNTYTYLPMDDVKYPFLTIGETQLLIKPTKSYMIGTVNITLHLYGTIQNRLQLSNMQHDLTDAISKIKYNDNELNFILRYKDIEHRILQDNSTNQTLYHAITYLKFDVL